MNSDNNIQGFFDKLSVSTKQQSKNFQVTNKVVNELLLIEAKSAKAEKKEQKDEYRHNKRLLQLKKRKEKQQKGPIQVLFGGKEKQEGKGMNAWLMGALGLSVVGGAGAWLLSDDPNAKKIREKIEETTKDLAATLKKELQKAVDEFFSDVAAGINKQANDLMRGSGMGGTTVEGQQSNIIREAQGSYADKMRELEGQSKGSGGFVSWISGEQSEAKQGLYRLQAGEEWQNTPDFRMGGSLTRRGPIKGIVTGDITRAREEGGVNREQKNILKKLETLSRDRREYNDRIAKDADDSEANDLLSQTDRQIASILEENAQLVEVMEQMAEERVLAYDNPVERQTGGALNMKGGKPFTVPGSGIGDSFYQPLPANSFVLNKRASREFNVKAKKRQSGGHIGKATKHIMKDEALSSLSKGPYPRGQSDFIKPGGTSVKSKTKWDSIKPNTKIYSYIDSVGVPTIGWGSTYYDNIRNGKKKVKSGDVITKSRADKALHDNIAGLNRDYAKQIPYWKKMSNSQRASLLSMGYNAPNFFGGFAPGLTAALKKGDMVAAAKNLSWGGPSQTRISESQAMMRQGPKDLSILKGPKIVGQGNSGQRIVGTGNSLVDSVRGMIGGPRVGDIIKKQSGGPIIVPGTGEGDQVPMNLPEGSFVLNRSASRRLQNGGVVGDYSEMARFAQASVAGDMPIPEPKVVIVKRRGTPPPSPSKVSAPDLTSSGGVNICEMSDTLHRIQSGASF